MPELPEVESLRRQLVHSLVGRTITSFEVGVPKLFQAGPGLSGGDLLGKTILRIGRKGKLLRWDLSDGLVLVIHLKLAGQIVHLSEDRQDLAHGGHPVPRWGFSLPHKATHVTMTFGDASTLYLTDIRQFARLRLLRTRDARRFLKDQRLGPDPLKAGFTPTYLYAALQRRSVPVKAVLLDQQVVGGIGNIYADESLWVARILPSRSARSIAEAEAKRLHLAVRRVLRYALREGVAVVPQGKAISDRPFPYCHGRAGAPCSRCGTTILKGRVAGRGTYWCPTCQIEIHARAA